MDQRKTKLKIGRQVPRLPLTGMTSGESGGGAENESPQLSSGGGKWGWVPLSQSSIRIVKIRRPMSTRKTILLPLILILTDMEQNRTGYRPEGYIEQEAQIPPMIVQASTKVELPSQPYFNH